jgi:hypothetical protein
MKFKLKGRRFDTNEIQAEQQTVLDTLTQKDFQEAFQKWRRWDRCLHTGTTLRMMKADRPYGEVYDFYGVSPKYFRYHLAYSLNW